MILKHLAPLALLALLAAPASAQISVNRSVIEFTDDARVQDIEVLNGGADRVYLDLSVAEILEPDSETPRRVEFDDPRTAPVLVSPRQLLVPPGTRKRVRVILRQESDAEQVFRLRVKPYTGSARLTATGDDKKSSAIRVLVGYDLLLIARPAELRPDVRVTRDEDSIEFVNGGNTNVLLRRIVQCEAGVDPDAPDAAGACEEMQPNRLYAGETYRVALPRRGAAERFPVKVWQAIGLESSSEVF